MLARKRKQCTPKRSRNQSRNPSVGMAKNESMWVDVNFNAIKQAKRLNGGVVPYTPALETTDFPHKDEWNNDNLPDILFYLVLPQSRYKTEKLKDLLDDEGNPVMNQEGTRPLRDFEILPRRISLDVEAWLIEAWKRLDTRITYQDILDRQLADPNFAGGLGLTKLDKNSMQNHCRRSCRRVLNSWVEYGRRGEPHRTDVQTIENLSYQNILDNSVLNRSAEQPDRLQKVKIRRDKNPGSYYVEPLTINEHNIEKTSYPLNHFTRHLGVRTGENVMSKSMKDAWDLLLILSERAENHGLESWKKLGQSCVPASWYDRTKKAAIINDAYDGGCSECTWDPERKKKPTSKKRSRKSATSNSAEEAPRRKRYRTRETVRCRSTEANEDAATPKFQDDEESNTVFSENPEGEPDDNADDKSNSNNEDESGNENLDADDSADDSDDKSEDDRSISWHGEGRDPSRYKVIFLEEDESTPEPSEGEEENVDKVIFLEEDESTPEPSGDEQENVDSHASSQDPTEDNSNNPVRDAEQRANDRQIFLQPRSPVAHGDSSGPLTDWGTSHNPEMNFSFAPLPPPTRPQARAQPIRWPSSGQMQTSSWLQPAANGGWEPANIQLWRPDVVYLPTARPSQHNQPAAPLPNNAAILPPNAPADADESGIASSSAS